MSSRSQCSRNLSDATDELESRNYVNKLRHRTRNGLSGSARTAAQLENFSKYLVAWDLEHQRLNHVPNEGVAADKHDAFVTLCNLRASGSDRIQTFASPKLFQEATQAWHTSNSPESHIVFMKGNPSPSWLVAVGSRYGVEYDFFNKHLDFRATVGKPDYLMLPSLPSVSKQHPRLRVTTVSGLLKDLPEPVSQTFIDDLRERNVRSLKKYQDQLKLDRDVGLGDSFIRQFSTHDEAHFSLEQDVSVRVTRKRHSWAAIVWFDAGKDLGKGPAAKWLLSPLRVDSWNFVDYFPTALPTSSARNGGNSPDDVELNNLPAHHDPPRVFQTQQLIPHEYGVDLNPRVAAEDPFYALSELFSFAALTENQFLNLIASKIAKETDLDLLARREHPSINNLLYTQHILERHISRLEENIRTLEDRDSLGWPSGWEIAQNQGIDLGTLARNLLADYLYLLSRSKSLLASSERGTQVVTKFLQTQESREQITEAKSITTLTRLAFVFIPLSLVSSAFGMNVTQLGSGTISIWVFFVTCAPVLVASVLFLALFDRAGATAKSLLWRRNKRLR